MSHRRVRIAAAAASLAIALLTLAACAPEPEAASDARALATSTESPTPIATRSARCDTAAHVAAADRLPGDPDRGRAGGARRQCH